MLKSPITASANDSAVVPSPIAVDNSPLAIVSFPIAVDVSPVAVVKSPIANDLSPLAVVLAPIDIEDSPIFASSHSVLPTPPTLKAAFAGLKNIRVPAPLISGTAPLP